MLEFTRVGRVRQIPDTMDWREVANEALQLVAGGIAQRGARVDIAENAIILHGERARFVQIWQNLIDNAVKFGEGQAALHIRIGVENAGKKAVFFVCDNGAGIEPRYQEKIFNLFEKLDANAPGTGLGLALAKRVVEQYSGTITVESPGLGQGACFRFSLPDAIQTTLDGENP